MVSLENGPSVDIRTPGRVGYVLHVRGSAHTWPAPYTLTRIGRGRQVGIAGVSKNCLSLSQLLSRKKM